MAQNEEPMDIDHIESDFDNKENSTHHNSVYPRTPCTEKGYEELDVSELNMKLRYSMTPVSSPMSKSYTANCVENKHQESDDNIINANLTRSFNSTITKNDVMNKSVKSMPLQMTTDYSLDNNRNTSVLRPLDTTSIINTGNKTITVTEKNDVDDNLSIPSSLSSNTHTPELTTPTKGISPTDGGSPIMRGLKTVLNMFRASQSPIPPESENVAKQVLSPPDQPSEVDVNLQTPQTVLASTPIAAHRNREGNVSKRNSPLKESIVFNEDLEKELLWKDETTILFNEEKIPIHKLFYQQPIPNITISKKLNDEQVVESLNSTVEYMDISYNDAASQSKTINNGQSGNPLIVAESDGEFVDCETTLNEEIQASSNENITNNTLENENWQQIDITRNKLDDLITKTENIKFVSEDLANKQNINVCNTTEVLEQYETVNSTLLMPETKKTEFQLDGILETIVDNVKEKESTAEYVPRNQDNANFKPKDQILSPETLNLEFTTQDNIAKEVQPEVHKNSQPLFNFTFESENTPVQDNTILMEKSVTTILLPEPCDEKVNFENSSTVIKEANCLATKDSIEYNSTKVDDQDLPANIPLPDEDETENNLEAINNIITDIKLESPTHTDNMPIETKDQAKPVDFNIATKDTFMESTNVSNAEVIENKIEEMLYSTKIIKNNVNLDNSTNNKKIGDVEVHMVKNDLQHVLSDINNIINDAQTFVNLQQNVLIQVTDVDKNLENNLTNIQPQLAEERQNEAITDILPTECEIVNEKIENPLNINSLKRTESNVNPAGFNKFDHQKETTRDIVYPVSCYETQSKPDVSQLNMSVHDILPDSQKDHTSSSTFDGFVINHNSDVIQHKIDESQLNMSVHKILPECEEDHTLSSTVDGPVINYNSDVIQHKIDENEILPESEKDHTSSSTFDGFVINHNSDVIQHKIDESQLNMIVHKILPECEKDHTSSSTVDGPVINYNSDVIQHKIDENEILPESEKDHTSCSTVDGSVISHNSDTIQHEIDENCMIKLETLPDLIPDTISAAPTEIQNNSFDHKPNMEINTDQTRDETSNETINEQQIENKNGIENVDVEILLSENNSPYVSIDAHLEQITEQPLNIETIESSSVVVISPPISPKITSKGYNFNFDEIDDPFATKTKIRMSPPLDSPKSASIKNVDKNRRKSQPERKKPMQVKKNMNSTYSGPLNIQEDKPVNKVDSERLTNASHIDVCHDSYNKIDTLTSDSNVTDTIQDTDLVLKQEIESSVPIENEGKIIDNLITNVVRKEEINETKPVTKELDISSNIVCSEENKSSIESLTYSMDVKNTSSSEQSAYYSAATSSGEYPEKRNVFNIPEIDDINFNPFVTKSKVRVTPDKEVSFSTEHNKSIEFTKNTVDREISDNKECVDSSNITCSSKTTDEKDITVQEILTEDEDTVEGPFLENEDFNVDDKMSDIDGNDLMLFSELPKPVKDDNLDDGELFIDAEAFEFLLNQNQNNAVAESAKESLFLKFDPLFAKRVSSDGVLSVLKKAQRRQSTPKKTSVLQQLNSTFEKHVAGPSNMNETQEFNITAEESADDLNVTVTKPTMVVTPAVNPIITPRNKPITPTSSNRRSITFTSPAIAVIDRLLSMSGNSSILGDTTTTQVNREQNEAELALTQLRELLADKEINVYNLRSESKELKDRLSNLESQMRILESESEDRLKKVNELNEKLSEKTKINKSMAVVVEEYERTIASLIAETEQDKKRNNEERIKLIQERDEQTAHLASMEVSFSDLHSKYEKSKQIILTCKANEDAYRKSIKEFEDNISKMQSNYELLKQHATSKLNHANQELEKMNRTHEAEVLKLNAMIKRKDLHITSLEETLAQKTKANEELAAICDELINKVG